MMARLEKSPWSSVPSVVRGMLIVVQMGLIVLTGGTCPGVKSAIANDREVLIRVLKEWKSGKGAEGRKRAADIVRVFESIEQSFDGLMLTKTLSRMSRTSDSGGGPGANNRAILDKLESEADETLNTYNAFVGKLTKNDLALKTNSGDSIWWVAIRYAKITGNLEALRRMMDLGANIEERSAGLKTPLIEAAEFSPELVKLLLERGARVDRLDNEKNTPLIVAAKQGLVDAAKILLDSGAKVDAANEQGTTALLNAASEGKADVVRLLLDRGATAGRKDKFERTALMWAAQANDPALLELVLARDIDVNAADYVGDTALMYASRRGHTGNVRLLLEKKALVDAADKKGLTALMVAANYGQVETVRFLLEQRAGIDAKDNDGWTALMYAAYEGFKEVAALLIAKGAKVDASDAKGRTPLMAASRKGNAEIARMLLEQGAEVNAKNGDGWSALMLAAGEGQADVVRVLLEKGADVRAKTSGGFTPLAIAASHTQLEVIRVLDERGAPLGFEDDADVRNSLLCIVNISIGKISEATEICIANMNTYVNTYAQEADVSKKAQKLSSASFYALLGKEPRKAARYASQAVEYDKEYLMVFSNLGHALLLTGDRLKAALAYKKFLSGREHDYKEELMKDFKLLKLIYVAKARLLSEMEAELSRL